MRTSVRTKARTAPKPQIAPSFARWIAIAAMFCAMSALLGGCAGFQEKVDREPTDKWYSKDLPVPDRFELDQKASRIHDRGGHREIKLIYRRQSFEAVDRAEEFYREAFTTAGWKVKFVYGMQRRHIILWKGDEECRVTIDKSDSMVNPYVWAVVEVEPKDPHTGSVAAK